MEATDGIPTFQDVAERKRDFIVGALAECIRKATRGIVAPVEYEWSEDGTREVVWLQVRGEDRLVGVNVHMDSEWAVLKDVMTVAARYYE